MKVRRSTSRGSGVTRRGFLRVAAGSAAAAGLGVPAVMRAQQPPIRVGHLTPRTGFLAPLGEYAVMGARQAVDEFNEKGGVLGRKVELITEDSQNPGVAKQKVIKLIEKDKEKKGSGPTNLKLLFGNRSPARNTWPQVLEGESKCRDDHDFIFRVVCITSSRGGIAGK